MRAGFDAERAAPAVIDPLYFLRDRFRVIPVLDAINRLSEYDPDIKPIADAVAPLEVLNATTVDELKKQLNEAKEGIDAARAALVK